MKHVLGTSASSAKTSGKIGAIVLVYYMMVNFGGSVFGVFSGLIIKEGRHFYSRDHSQKLRILSVHGASALR